MRLTPAPLEMQGFSIVEVFVAILITMIYLTIALQMFVTAAYLRSRADQFSQAYNWIQEDLERSRAKATAFEKDAIPYSSYCGADPVNNLAAAFIESSTEGLGGPNVTVGTRTYNGEDFALMRSAKSTTTSVPDRLVALEYELVPAGGGNPIFRMDAEVVLYAAFQCPL